VNKPGLSLFIYKFQVIGTSLNFHSFVKHRFINRLAFQNSVADLQTVGFDIVRGSTRKEGASDSKRPSDILGQKGLPLLNRSAVNQRSTRTAGATWKRRERGSS
jgi:hypothetical protein